MDCEMDAALSSGDDTALIEKKKKPSRLKPSDPASIEQDFTRSEKFINERHQPGDTVEARFGRRSKWFPGKVKVTRNCVFKGPKFLTKKVS